MIQFNLLPTVKLEYVRAERNKRMILLIAGSVTGLAVIIVTILFVAVSVVQKNYSASLSDQIKTETSTLQNVSNLNKIITIQNQLTSLTTLHSKKPVATRLLGFITQVTPAKVSIANLSTDYSANTMSITGSADALSTINTFIDTLKFTNFSIQYKDGESKITCAFPEVSYDQNTKTQICPAFSAVVLTSFSREAKTASYQTNFKFDPAIFASTHDVKLIVPAGKITTRSETEKPLFQPLTTPLPIPQTDKQTGTTNTNQTTGP